MKNIGDYLHLYIGQLFRYSYVEQPDQFSAWVLMTPSRYAKLDDLSIAKVQLQLRPVSSMTEEEIVHLVQILLNKKDVHVVIERTDDKEFIIAKYNTVYPEHEHERERFDKLEMRLTISNIGHPFSLQNNWDYTKGNQTGVSNEQLHNCHEMTRWLLSKGFDLFGLIEDGLAIEKKTETQNV